MAKTPTGLTGSDYNSPENIAARDENRRKREEGYARDRAAGVTSGPTFKDAAAADPKDYAFSFINVHTDRTYDEKNQRLTLKLHDGYELSELIKCLQTLKLEGHGREGSPIVYIDGKDQLRKAQKAGIRDSKDDKRYVGIGGDYSDPDVLKEKQRNWDRTLNQPLEKAAILGGGKLSPQAAKDLASSWISVHCTHDYDKKAGTVTFTPKDGWDLWDLQENLKTLKVSGKTADGGITVKSRDVEKADIHVKGLNEAGESKSSVPGVFR